METHDDPRLPSFIRRMLRPEFYPHPVEEPIRLVQTHISYVLLTGLYAYKVKKAVNLGFLDYSTLERRRHFCEEEVRLNARGAPGLYLGVVPIPDAPGGAAVEYAVRMRQFPEGALYSERMHRGEFGVREMQFLARATARYHAAAPTDDRVRSFGQPERVLATIEQNFAQTERFVSKAGPLTRETFEETRQFTRRFIADHDSALRGRVESGHVRECHGDLHLANVCEWEGKLLLFDCIEFNDAFRFVDTAYDVAFAAMDLEARGRPDLASSFLNVYLERSSDWEAGRVLPLYLCRQAYVRGKVNSFLAEEPEAGPEARQGAAAQARHYYGLALQYARRFGAAGVGRLVLMSGLSGTGKSTVAAEIVRSLGTGAIRLRSDALRKHLASAPLDRRGGPDLYTPEMTDRTYARLIELGAQLAAVGWVVVLDAKFDRAAQRRQAADVARARGLPIQIVHCHLPEDQMRRRLAERTGDVSDATPALVDEQIRAFEPFADAEMPSVVSIDTTWPVEAAGQALRLLGVSPVLPASTATATAPSSTGSP